MKKYRIAVLDDYQNVALKSADWSVLRDRADIAVFQDHLADPDAVIGRLLPFDVVCVMRERTPLPRNVIERIPNLKYMVGVTMEGLEKNTVRCPVELRITFEARFCASWTCAGKDARKIDEALDAANAAWAVQPELPCNDKSTMGRKSDDLFVPPTGGTRSSRGASSHD
jgi:hypothetical protein